MNTLTDYLEQQLPATLELLRRMVEINSFTTNTAGVDKLACFTAEAFAPLGFTDEHVPSAYADYGKHLVMTRPGKLKRVIQLISHLDTVFPPEEEQRNDFHWRVAGDKIYGPGTMDIKGGTVMIWLTLLGLRHINPAAFEEVTWVVLLNSSEEVYSPDFGKLCLQHLGPSPVAALVFEAGVQSGNEFLVVASRKGRAAYKIKTEGRGAHAGASHERGANAVVQMAEVIGKVAALTNYEKEITFNIGNVSGGTVINRIPHEAFAEGEMRSFNREFYHAGLAALRAMQGPGSVKAASDGAACQVKVEITTETPPWPRNDGTEKLVQVWKQAAAQLGFTVLHEDRGGLSDGNLICHAVPTLDGLGPHGDNGHCSEQSADGTKEQEFVQTSSFVPKAALNTLALLQLIQPA